MRIRWETRLKTGSYAARCRKRAGRVRLEQRPVHRRTDPGTARPGQALTARLSPGDNLLPKPAAESSEASGRRIRCFSPLSLSSPPLLSAPQEKQRDIGNVAAKRVGFIAAVLLFCIDCKYNRTETLSDSSGVHYGFIGGPQ